ncbi:MAG TPA: tRNA glutamyl-Q(34) synthetase GluQRS [Burkholderiales bacterium]|nr:tRNA glutamyl-Q(34) synthetase GluQRS [Burkholderiales bacterium]
MSAYRGRFAPTPSGPLHFGSMVAAVGSYLDAKSRNGEWLVRIDDLDPPRVAAGSVDAILRCLQAFGMQWDDEVVFQCKRNDAYRSALEQLQARDLVYGCACSRKEIGDTAIAGIEGPVYPGTCRGGLPSGREARSWRVRTAGIEISFQDLLQGRVRQDLEHDIGDFVVYRADGVFAYHLACAVDDAWQGITHVVRGADLLASTPRQIHLQNLLGLPAVEYLHLPVAQNAAGEKLSKQTLAAAVDPADATVVLAEVLAFLDHAPPADVRRDGIATLWKWARDNWRRERLPHVSGLPADTGQNTTGAPSRNASS